MTTAEIISIIKTAQQEIQEYDDLIESLQRTTEFPLSPTTKQNIQNIFNEFISPKATVVNLTVLNEESHLLLQILSHINAMIGDDYTERLTVWKTEILASKIYIHILASLPSGSVNKDWVLGKYRNLDCRSRIVTCTQAYYISIISRSIDAIGVWSIPTEINVNQILISGSICVCDENHCGRTICALALKVLTLKAGMKYHYQINTMPSTKYNQYLAIEIGTGIINSNVKAQIGFKEPSMMRNIISYLRPTRS
jgi:hypothetical protein